MWTAPDFAHLRAIGLPVAGPAEGSGAGPAEATVGGDAPPVVRSDEAEATGKDVAESGSGRLKAECSCVR